MGKHILKSPPPSEVSTPSSTRSIPPKGAADTTAAKAAVSTPSMLKAETPTMEDNRRKDVQRYIASQFDVHVQERREHEEPLANTPEGEFQNDMKQHPFLSQMQRFDGIDPNVNPNPPMNTLAKTEWENAKREQELQHRLNNVPKPGAPAPRPGYSS